MGNIKVASALGVASLLTVLVSLAFPTAFSLSTVGTPVNFSCVTQTAAAQLGTSYPPAGWWPDNSANGTGACPGLYDGYYTPGAPITNTNNCPGGCQIGTSSATVAVTSGTVTITTTVPIPVTTMSVTSGTNCSTNPNLVCVTTTQSTTSTTVQTALCGGVPYNPATQTCNSQTTTTPTHSQPTPTTTQGVTISTTTQTQTQTYTRTTSGVASTTTAVVTSTLSSNGKLSWPWPWSLLLNIGLDIGIVLAVSSIAVWRKD